MKSVIYCRKAGVPCVTEAGMLLSTTKMPDEQLFGIQKCGLEYRNVRSPVQLYYNHVED